MAIDGSKVQANASKHKAMSCDRMREKTRQLRDEVQDLLGQAEAADAAEDAEYGADQRDDELPAELQRRESRLARIREARRALEARAKAEAAPADASTDTATSFDLICAGNSGARRHGNAGIDAVSSATSCRRLAYARPNHTTPRVKGRSQCPADRLECVANRPGSTTAKEIGSTISRGAPLSAVATGDIDQHARSAR